MFKRYMEIDGLTPVCINKEYLISITGNIVSKSGDSCARYIKPDGTMMVTLNGPEGSRDYSLAWLICIQFKGLSIPEQDYEKLEVFYNDKDPGNLHASNIGYRFKGGKLESKQYPGYYYVPGIPDLVINSKGDGIRVKSGKKLVYYVTKPGVKNSKGGYYTTSIPYPSSRPISVSRHRVLMLVFSTYPDNVDELVVNHIDGVPGHDDLDNLEWVTRKQNNVDAIENGLKSQNMPVLTRHILTGEINRYRSMSDCSFQLGFPTDETVRQRIKGSAFGTVFSDGLQLKLESDTRDWLLPKDPHEAIKKARQCIPVKVRDCLTLVIKEFSSMADASRALDILISTINLRLNTDNRSPLEGYQFMYLEDTRSWPSFTTQEYQESLKPSRLKIHGKNLITGETDEWESTRAATKDFNLHTIAGRLRKGDQPLYSNGWVFKYEDDEWKDIEDPEQALYELQKDIMFRRESDGAIFISDKFKGYTDTLGLHYQAAKAAAMTRGRAIYNGYRIRLGLSSEPWPTDDIKFNHLKWLKEHSAQA